MLESKVPLANWQGGANPTDATPLLEQFRDLLPEVTQRNKCLVGLLAQHGEGSNAGFVQQLGSLVVDRNKPPSWLWHMPGPILGNGAEDKASSLSHSVTHITHITPLTHSLTIKGVANKSGNSPHATEYSDNTETLAYKAKPT